VQIVVDFSPWLAIMACYRLRTILTLRKRCGDLVVLGHLFCWAVALQVLVLNSNRTNWYGSDGAFEPPVPRATSLLADSINVFTCDNGTSMEYGMKSFIQNQIFRREKAARSTVLTFFLGDEASGSLILRHVFVKLSSV
jgi:hypothetical protein